MRSLTCEEREQLRKQFEIKSRKLEERSTANYLRFKFLHFFKFIGINSRNHFNKAFCSGNFGSRGEHCPKCGSPATYWVYSLFSYQFCVNCRNTYYYKDEIKEEDIGHMFSNGLSIDVMRQIEDKKRRLNDLNSNPEKYVHDNL